MITLSVIKRWITDTLANSTEFKDYCTATIGEELNLYRSTPVHKVAETIPFLTVYGMGKEDDRNQPSGYQETWNIPITIGIEEKKNYDSDGSYNEQNGYIVDSNNVKVWESSEKVELIEAKMLEVLSKEIKCGISGNYIRIINVQTFITEIGEADDVESQTFITFGKEKDV